MRNGLRKALVSPTIAAIGAVDENGNVDVDGIAEVFLDQVPKEGFPVGVPILGELTFFREDVTRLVDYIKEE